MEDNLTSADPLSYTTNGSRVDLGSLISVSCVHNLTPFCGSPDQKYYNTKSRQNFHFLAFFTFIGPFHSNSIMYSMPIKIDLDGDRDAVVSRGQSFGPLRPTTPERRKVIIPGSVLIAPKTHACCT